MTIAKKIKKPLQGLLRALRTYTGPLAPIGWLIALHWHAAIRWALWQWRPLHPELTWRSSMINRYELRLGVRGVKL